MMPASSKNIFLVTILWLLGFLVFGRSLWYDFIIYDDPAFITENQYVAKGLSLRGLEWSIFYNSDLGSLSHKGVENLWQPLTWVSHMIDVQIYGIESGYGHHLTNLIIHILSGCFVMWCGSALFKNRLTGFLLAILWMIHPLKVESVAWISERKGLLSGLFFWASISFVLRGHFTKKLYLTIGYILFLAATLSKPSTVILPCLVLLLQGYINKENRWGISFILNGIKKWWLWFLTSVIISLITIQMQAEGSHKYFIGESSIVSKVMQIGTGFWFLIWRAIFPWNLTVEYGYPNEGIWVYIISWVGLLSVSVLFWNKRKEWRLSFLGFIWFIVCWLPSSGVLYVGKSFTCDRYLYLALAGPLFIIAHWVTQNKKWRIYCCICLAVIWSAISWNQVKVWRDGWSLYQHMTKAQPQLSQGWVNLGGMHKASNQYEEAIYCYEKAIKLNPNSYFGWYNLGVIYKEQDLTEQALEAYQKSLSIYPNYHPSLLNLGLIMRDQGNIESAREHFKKGSKQNINMLWLWCESELVLGNLSQAQELLSNLEEMPIQHPNILEGMKQARVFLNQRSAK